MINLENIKRVYFLGIGGIGMSAIARYFNSHGFQVAGYDRVESEITKALQAEGIHICFDDNPELIDKPFLNKNECLLVYTPAIPENHWQKKAFVDRGFKPYKRAEVLGLLSRSLLTLGVAGTHGKTTVSTMLAWLMQFTSEKSHAFLGGISSNFQSNYVDGENSRYMVVEADEFDRSFLQLAPNCSIITSIDADHLDIYKTHENLLQAFVEYAESNKNFVVHKFGLPFNLKVKSYTYALDNSNADFFASNIRRNGICYSYCLHTPNGMIENLELSVPGILNLENSIAASALALLNGLDETGLRKALSQFSGIRRRFEIIVQQPNVTYIDDYAHHPVEISRTLESLRQTFPDKHLTAIFQPHLFSRTQDFFDAFAESLSGFDQVLLLPIYPARENPIPGVESEIILKKMTCAKAEIVQKSDLLNVVKSLKPEVLVTLGAGDIDRFVKPLKQMLSE